VSSIFGIHSIPAYFFLYQVNKFVMDDKGALLLCAWGLPPMAHTDDPHRATAAVFDIVVFT
jgi:hypothetical protein